MARDSQARHPRSLDYAVLPEAMQALPADHRVRCVLRGSFDAEVANDNIRNMLAELQPLQGTSLLLSCWERCEAKFEPDFYHAFASQFGCQFWSLVQEHIPDVWPAKATPEPGPEEDEGCRSDKPQKRQKRGT